jgi:hypothetical protein
MFKIYLSIVSIFSVCSIIIWGLISEKKGEGGIILDLNF